MGTKGNNYSDGNLEWVSKQDNMLHASQEGLINKNSEKRVAAVLKSRERALEIIRKPILQLDKNGHILGRFSCAKEAAALVGCNEHSIHVVAGHQGYHRTAEVFSGYTRTNLIPRKTTNILLNSLRVTQNLSLNIL